MVKVTLKGGIGNQMFQYAFARSLAISMATNVIIDTSFLNTRGRKIVPRKYGLGDLNITISSENITDAELVTENKLYCYSRKIVESVISGQPKNVWLRHGYWQSYKYFQEHSDIIAGELTPKTPLPVSVAGIAKDMKRTNSVLIHVRRTDYTKNNPHPCYGVNYIQKCVDLLADKVSDLKMFVFSDDLQWCKENLSFNNCEFVDEFHDEPHYQMYLMSMCKHFIIPASSFSWWSAWLSKYPDKIVICPKTWYSRPHHKNAEDLIPANWIRL